MSRRVRGLLDRLLTRRRAAAGVGVPDAELLRRYARDRDEAAFELLVWRHGPMVLGVCRRGVRDEQLAEDAFQAVFLVLALKAEAVRGNVGGWLFRIARRVSARAAARPPAVQPVTDAPAAVEPDHLERRELSELLDAEIARLPARLRGAVVLCYLGGRSTEDAARELGCPRGTVLSRLAAARARLADRLTRRGVTAPATLAATVTHRTASSAVAAARAFRAGTLAASAASQLATGVLHAMTRTTVLAATGVVAFAALLTGVGWTAASGDGPAPTAASTVAQDRKADPPAVKEPRTPTASTKQTAERAADDKVQKLEQVAGELRREIELAEKAVGAMIGAELKNETALAVLDKRLAELEQAVFVAERELAQLGAEATVLKRRVEAKANPASKEYLAQVVENEPEVHTAAREVTLARLRVERAKANATDPDAPPIKKLEAEAVAAAKALEDVRESLRRKLTPEVVKRLLDERNKPHRDRLAELELKAEIKNEELTGLKQQHDALRREIGATAEAGARAAELRRAVEPHREMLARVQRELLMLKAKQSGVTLAEPAGSESKLDAILRELAALRKEVQELKGQRK